MSSRRGRHRSRTPESEGMINREFFRNLRKGAYLVNTARGRLVNHGALAEAVQAGTLAGAALDVYDYEPLCDPRIICTPHISGASRDVISHQSEKILEALRAYSSGLEIPYLIA